MLQFNDKTLLGDSAISESGGIVKDGKIETEVGYILLLVFGFLLPCIGGAWYIQSFAATQFFGLPTVPAQDFIPLIIGTKTVAMFDLWSIDHFAWGVVIGTVLICLAKVEPPRFELLKFVLWMLILAYAWEGHETWMEIGGRGTSIGQWKDGVEHWSNKFLSDPGMVLLGGMLARGVKSSWKPALVYMILWSIANVLAPDCMFIQNMLVLVLGG
jgi:hypothetical protein